MKKKFNLFIGATVVMILSLLWLDHSRRADRALREQNEREQLQSGGTIPTQQPTIPTPPFAGSSNAQTKQPQGKPTMVSADKPRNIEEWMEKEYGHPIEFYGKVADESEMPIVGANITFDWANAKGKGLYASTTSDGSGLFFIVDIKGKNLGVRASKDGYYPRYNSFEYADPGRGLFTPDHSNPVVFHLHKKGPGADLVTSEHGVKSYLGVPMPLNGTPVQVDLAGRTVGHGGPLTASQIKPEYENWKHATNWAFQLEIPDGGFVAETNEFPFEAPETGYKSIVQFNFQAGTPDWAENLQKDFYIKFGNPSRYGRLHLETSIMMSGARLTYSINPDGSRYLEPK